MMDKTLSRREIGFRYEMIARRYLEKAGLVFKEANVTLRSAEIDLIMRDQKTWVFVEVRFKRNSFFGSAADSINNKKQKRLRDAAAIWLSKRGSHFNTSYRFDVFAITGNQFEWFQNSFN